MARFITLAGKKQVGKDTSAKMLSDVLSETHSGNIFIVHFADALKKACNVIFGISLEDMETEEGKQKLTHVRWPHLNDNPGFTDNWMPDSNGAFMTVREVLQFVGTELFRNQMDPDVWLNSVFMQPWQESDVVIIADARFPNEAALGRKHGVLINVSRDTGLGGDSHVSESALDEFDDYHYRVDNNSSFKELEMHLSAILMQNQFVVTA